MKTSDQVGIENSKKLSSQLLTFTTQKIATHSTDIISAVGVASCSVVNARRREKSCLQFLIPTTVFHMLLSRDSNLMFFKVQISILKSITLLSLLLNSGDCRSHEYYPNTRE